MKSIWIDDHKERSYLRENKEVDVAIIGAGMVGILTAYYLKRKGLSTVILEADKIGSGQTGHTTAKITCQHGLIYEKLLRNFGKEIGSEYAKLNTRAIDDYRKVIEREKIACEFSRIPAYLYSKEGEFLLKKEEEASRILGIDCHFVKHTELPFHVAGALVFNNQAQFDPLMFLNHLAKNLIIYENTPVIKIKENIVQTREATVKAEHIVMATHYPFINRPGYFFTKIHQKRSYVVALENATRLEGMYLGIDKGYAYSLRNVGKYLLFGGEGHRTGRIPKEDPYQVLCKEGRKLWSESSLVAKWSAQDCITLDSIPYIGRFSKKTPNWYVATGFGKWGMTQSMVGAQSITRQILGIEDSSTTLFYPGRFSVSRDLPAILREGLGSGKNLIKGIFAGKSRCSHLGCKLQWNPYEDTWECPCHGSRFNGKGQLMDNPAQVGLHND
ncbi:MAG: FAD-dependent oxidoreductase [Anaerovoracaceae bacterium]